MDAVQVLPHIAHIVKTLKERICVLQGFLSEGLDQFAQDVVYKTFSPTVGLFLACSAGYGLWKVSRAVYRQVVHQHVHQLSIVGTALVPGHKVNML